MRKKIVTISVSSEALNKIDQGAARLEMNRSQFLCWAAIHARDCKEWEEFMAKIPRPNL